MEEGYDEELEKLLGEIPRATSTPPHLEDLHIAHRCQHQHSLKQVFQMDIPSDEVTVMKTLGTRPFLYTPFSKPLSSNPFSPRYGGLPANNYDNTSFDKRQSRHPVDLNLQYNGSLPYVSSEYLAHPGRVVLPAANREVTSTLQDHSQNRAEQKNSDVSSSDACIESVSNSGAAKSSSETLFLTSCLPPSLQMLDPFSQNAADCAEIEADNDLEEWQKAESYTMHLVHGLKNPLEVQGVRKILDQSVPIPEPPLSSLTGSVPMHLGPQGSRPDGAFLLCPSANFVLPYPSDMKVMYTQQMHEAAAQQQIQEQVLCRQRIKEEFLLRQQKLRELQAQFYASLESQPELVYSRCHSGMQHNHPMQASSCTFEGIQHQLTSKPTLGGSIMRDRMKSTAGMWASPVVLSRQTYEASGCEFFLHGFCTRGDVCPSPHSCMQSNSILRNGELMLSEASVTLKGSRNGLFMPAVVVPALKKKNYLANGHLSRILSNVTHLPSPNHLSSMSGGDSWKGMDSEVLQSVNNQHLVLHSPPPPKYTTLKEVEGHIYGIAKDQHGCRFLQRKFGEGVSEVVQKIFVEIIDHVVELMTDPFGNYLVQKLLEVCNEVQRREILYKVTGKDQLVTISLNMHGTRAVQKLIETLTSVEQVRLVVASLKQGVVTLINDLNGNHVVQRCLQRLNTEDSQFIFDAAMSHCIEIATHRHGCCVLQRCVDFSSGQQRNCLVTEIAANALVLSQDPFGNYVVQYILDLGLNWAVAEVIAHLDGNFVHLATQKFSSNVVEKCLKLSGEESKAHIIGELMSSSRLSQLLQDPFANYVVQSALMVSKGTLHFGLVEAIRPHLPALRSSPYGKRILSRTTLKK